MSKFNWETLKHTLVYETNINGKTFKAKIDTDQRVEFSGSQAVTKGGDVVFSLAYDHKESLKAEQLPLNFGLKFRFSD